MLNKCLIANFTALANIFDVIRIYNVNLKKHKLNEVLFTDEKFASFHIIARHSNEAADGGDYCQDRCPGCELLRT